MNKYKERNKIKLRLGIIPICCILFIGFTLTDCNNTPNQKTVKQQTSGVYYTCSMHPQVHENKPGNCPICGMKLIKVVKNARQNIPLDSSLRYLTQPINEIVAGSYKVISPKKIGQMDTIKAYGYVAFDSSTINTVSTLIKGRITQLFVHYNHQKIQKGQLLMKIYSPKLLSIQRNLLHAVNKNNTSLAKNLKSQLLNLGINKRIINKIVKQRKTIPYVSIYSPYSGIIISLKAQQGMYVKAGQTVFTIQNMKQRWAILNVFNSEINNIEIGDKVLLNTVANPNKRIKEKISFIPPYRNSKSKTTAVRINLSDHWKTGILIQGQIIPSVKDTAWVVPASSVNLLGGNAFVWVQSKEHPHFYKKKEVKVGEEFNNEIQIISGISGSNKIVKNAAYMVGSESFIQ